MDVLVFFVSKFGAFFGSQKKGATTVTVVEMESDRR